jgi:uncharacterized protein YbjQ (UPF0145 family)
VGGGFDVMTMKTLANVDGGGGAVGLLMSLLPLLLFAAFPLFLLVLGWWVGSRTERLHYESIRRREAQTGGLPVMTVRWGAEGREVVDARLVTGHVVISLDHFKRFLATIRQIFGGRVRSYESLVDRARREAVLRMKESCPQADVILNLRVETSVIGNTQGKQGLGAVEVIASGTAVSFQRV